MINTLRLLELDALVVETPTTTGSPARPSARRSRPTTTPAGRGVVATAGTTNAGIVDDLAGVAEVAR